MTNLQTRNDGSQEGPTPPSSRYENRLHAFLGDQHCAGVSPTDTSFFSCRDLGSAFLATVTDEALGAVTSPESSGARFRGALFGLALDCSQFRRDLIVDLSQVKYLNSESAFTLDDVNGFLTEKGRKLILTGVKGQPADKLALSQQAIGVSGKLITLADSPEAALLLAEEGR
ncbi:MAG: hypothetical protein KDD70_02205 [Bdellovibrionales bacterium]|nr:hypothetical protein [Bdellovibrionales bacterium]